MFTWYHFGWHRGSFFRILGANQVAKNIERQVFKKFLEAGGSSEATWGAISNDVGSKMGSLGLAWAMLWHLGAYMTNKSAKTEEDERN